MKITKRIILTVVIMCVICAISKFTVSATEETKEFKIQGVCYEVKDNNNYKYQDAEAVNKMSFGKEAVGSLYVKGVNLSEDTYNGVKAYGTTGNVTFSYVYDNTLLNASKDNWHIVSDKTKKVAGEKLDADILNGTIIIQKSYDGKTYENAVNPVVNFFDGKTSGKELYKSSGEDTCKGVYYRIIVAYKTEKCSGAFLWIDQYDKKRHIEVYDLFVVENSGVISVHNLSVDEELLEMEDYSQELIKKGETLIDGSVTRDGFQIESFTDSYTITVKKDSNQGVIAKSGDKFTSDGKYTITVKTLLGDTKSQTVYVFSGGNDKGYSTYFGENLVQAERVFREGDFPTYARGGQVHVNNVSASVPVLNGYIVDALTDEVVFELDGTRNEQTFLLVPGTYTAVLYNTSLDDAGSFYQYNFTFNVIDEESAPYVNYNNLCSSERLEDLQTKHYEVAYQTTGGGYIYVCFALDSYEEALNYAREIEGRFVESATDGGFYYKAEENPNRKIKYYDQIELTKVRDIYAKQNVEINYFNAADLFSYRTYNNDLLNCLEELSISESIKVFPSQEEKEKLISRTPFINNFTFIQASDYDVVSISALHNETGEIYEIEFGVPVDNQLTESGVYTITETNSYGKTRVYDATFLTECQTQMVWTVVKDEVESVVEIVPENATKGEPLLIEADSAYITKIENLYDEGAIVTVKAPGVYSFEIKCLASEFLNLEFRKAGEYEISFIDRIGNMYKILLVISGDMEYNAMQASTASYTTFYNSIYLNKKDDVEDFYELSDIVVEEPTVEKEPINPDSNTKEEQEVVEQEAIEETPNPLKRIIIVICGLVVVGGIVLIRGMKGKSKHEREKVVENHEED